MNLLPDAEQTQLLDAAIEFLRKEAPVKGGEPIDVVRQRMGAVFTAKVADLGWIGIGLSEGQGGVGYSLAEESLFFREFGRYLVSPGLLGSVLGARVAAIAGKQDIADAIIAGKALVGVTVPLGAAKIGEKVSGDFHLYESEGAEYALFCDESGAALVAMKSAQGLKTTLCFDERVHMATASFKDAPALAFVDAKTDDIFRRGVVLCAAMLAGVAEAARDVSAEYARTRVQFGQPIGAFQAIKHKCSDMAVRCEAAATTTFLAAVSVRDGAPTATLDSSAAKALAGEFAVDNSSLAVQVHGGMGYTEQMTPHLFVKRARIIDQLFGDRRHHLKDVLAATAA